MSLDSDDVVMISDGASAAATAGAVVLDSSDEEEPETSGGGGGSSSSCVLCKERVSSSRAHALSTGGHAHRQCVAQAAERVLDGKGALLRLSLTVSLLYFCSGSLEHGVTLADVSACIDPRAYARMALPCLLAARQLAAAPAHVAAPAKRSKVRNNPLPHNR